METHEKDDLQAEFYKDEQDKKETTGRAILQAIDLANLVRGVGGFKKIDDLVPGVDGDPQECVLANTFNCECSVEGTKSHESTRNVDARYTEDTGSAWYVWFEDKKFADALAGELNEKVYEYVNPSPIPGSIPVIEYGVRLPHDVGEIARKFDDGELDRMYYVTY